MIQPSREGGAPFIHSETLARVYIYLQFSKIRSKAKANRFVHSTGYLHACRLVKALTTCGSAQADCDQF